MGWVQSPSGSSPRVNGTEHSAREPPPVILKLRARQSCPGFGNPAGFAPGFLGSCKVRGDWMYGKEVPWQKSKLCSCWERLFLSAAVSNLECESSREGNAGGASDLGLGSKGLPKEGIQTFPGISVDLVESKRRRPSRSTGQVYWAGRFGFLIWKPGRNLGFGDFSSCCHPTPVPVAPIVTLPWSYFYLSPPPLGRDPKESLYPLMKFLSVHSLILCTASV